jgi:hypothetical protein
MVKEVAVSIAGIPFLHKVYRQGQEPWSGAPENLKYNISKFDNIFSCGELNVFLQLTKKLECSSLEGLSSLV